MVTCYLSLRNSIIAYNLTTEILQSEKLVCENGRELLVFFSTIKQNMSFFLLIKFLTLIDCCVGCFIPKQILADF